MGPASSCVLMGSFKTKIPELVTLAQLGALAVMALLSSNALSAAQTTSSSKYSRALLLVALLSSSTTPPTLVFVRSI